MNVFATRCNTQLNVPLILRYLCRSFQHPNGLLVVWRMRCNWQVYFKVVSGGNKTILGHLKRINLRGGERKTRGNDWKLCFAAKEMMRDYEPPYKLLWTVVVFTFHLHRWTMLYWLPLIGWSSQAKVIILSIVNRRVIYSPWFLLRAKKTRSGKRVNETLG